MDSYDKGFIGIIPNKTRVIIVYPTVDPQVVVVPILSSICIFPVFVFVLICILRKLAERRRRRERLCRRDNTLNQSQRSYASSILKSPPPSSTALTPDKEGWETDGTTTVELLTPDTDFCPESISDFGADYEAK